MKSRRQKVFLTVLAVVHFCNGICVSLQAPFYPQEAEEKGCSATEYGLVLGIYELTIFLTCPFYGKYLNKIGTKLSFNAGIYTTSICVILFGCLGSIPGHYPFIILSFIMRIFEGAGYGAFLTASASIIITEFPETVSTSFAFIETCFGMGIIVGPTIGGVLFQVGGYVTPFAVMGSILFLSSVFTSFVLPSSIRRYELSTQQPSILKALKIPGILLDSLSIIVTSMSIGFLQATLEPHLQQFSLTPILVGLMFVINGLGYALSAPIVGWLCDKQCRPKIVIVCGTAFISIAFCLIGPAPFLPLKTTITLTIIGLVFHGIGIAAQNVPTFTDALRTSLLHGFPNNIETFGLITGLWRSSFALGAFSGPSIGGLLYDTIGFRYSSLFVIVTQLFVGTLIAFYLICQKRQHGYIEIKEEVLTNGEITGSIKFPVQNGVNESIISCSSVGNPQLDTNSIKTLNSVNSCLGPYSHGYGTIHFSN